MNNIRKGDKVLFLLPNYPVYDQEGKDIFGKGISNCALGKSKTSNGFIWKY